MDLEGAPLEKRRVDVLSDSMRQHQRCIRVSNPKSKIPNPKSDHPIGR